MFNRFFLFLILLSAPFLSNAQSYSYEEVMKKSDKALRSFIPKHLMAFTQLYYTPYYASEGGDEQYFLLEKGKSTEGKLKQVNLRYKLKMKMPSCPAYDSVETIIEMELDNRLKLKSYKGLEMVPNFVMNNLPCNLLTRKQAQALVKKKGIEVQEMDFQLEYDPIEKKFQYFLTGDVIKAADNPENSLVESMVINAETGEIEENTFK